MLDRHEGQGRAREPRVGGDQGGTQPLGEGEIRGIIGGAGRAMLPDPGEEWEMRMSLDGQVREKRDRLLRPTLRHGSRAHEAPKDMDHLDIDELRRMDIVRLRQDELRLLGRSLRLRDDVHEDGGIDDEARSIDDERHALTPHRGCDAP